MVLRRHCHDVLLHIHSWWIVEDTPKTDRQTHLHTQTHTLPADKGFLRAKTSLGQVDKSLQAVPLIESLQGGGVSGSPPRGTEPDLTSFQHIMAHLEGLTCGLRNHLPQLWAWATARRGVSTLKWACQYLRTVSVSSPIKKETSWGVKLNSCQ